MLQKLTQLNIAVNVETILAGYTAYVLKSTKPYLKYYSYLQVGDCNQYAVVIF